VSPVSGVFSHSYGMLGSIDANTGDPLLGWDTDQFPMDIKKATLLAQVQSHIDFRKHSNLFDFTFWKMNICL
jgi:xylose isomerase